MNNSDRVKAMHLSSEELIEEAVKNNEVVIASNGLLMSPQSIKSDVVGS